MSLLDVFLGTADSWATPPTVVIDPAQWHDTAVALRTAGATYFEWLSAVDRGEHIDLALHVRDRGEGIIVIAPVAPGGTIASLTDVWAGAAWHERETAEMFGITFTGHNTERLLLVDLPEIVNPLLRTAPLERRVATVWPGRVEPGETEEDRARRARRGPQLPPGVRKEWVE